MKLQPVNYIITGIVLLFCQNGFAQSTATISPQRLPLIEQEMFNDSNQYFIIIDLMIDGLIKTGQSFDFRYGNGISTFNGKELEKSLQKKYAARMKAFYVHEGASTTTTFGMTSDSVSMKEILDPNSKLRNPQFKFCRLIQQQKQEQHDHVTNIINQMAGEHLLDTVASYYVKFDETGIIINNQKLEGTVEEKYMQLFKTLLNIEFDGKNRIIYCAGRQSCKKAGSIVLPKSLTV